MEKNKKTIYMVAAAVVVVVGGATAFFSQGQFSGLGPQGQGKVGFVAKCPKIVGTSQVTSWVPTQLTTMGGTQGAKQVVVMEDCKFVNATTKPKADTNPVLKNVNPAVNPAVVKPSTIQNR